MIHQQTNSLFIPEGSILPVEPFQVKYQRSMDIKERNEFDSNKHAGKSITRKRHKNTTLREEMKYRQNEVEQHLVAKNKLQIRR
jgi:hypothetical protein